MWQLLLLLVYISLLLIGRLHPQCVPRKLRPLLFIPNSLSNPESSSPPSSELIPFNSNSALVPETMEPNKYDVFISFRGGDVRNNFLSHLYAHLNDHKKLLTYKDDVDLQRGQEISPSLLRAIVVSDVYIVILSPNYADSPWCLEELERILQCKERHGRRVIPVFYGVDPSDVENLKLPSSTTGNIQSWRAALCEIANFSGFDSQVIRPETKLIDEIVKAVFQAIRGSSSQMVKYSSYSASRGLVGVERKMEQVEALLCLGDRSTRTIGFWGMAGVGKTALARAFFDLYSCQFEASYFFSNFSDTIASGVSLQPFGNLQSGFFSKLLGDDGVRGGLSYDLTLRRLGRMEALVVIDDVGNDVGNIGPVKDLLNGQYSDLFGPGSVIIVTGRNKQLLKTVCHQVYEVEGLGDEEAFQLFCLHAFREESIPNEYLHMIRSVIGYVGGNPLAITVLGAHLFGRDLKFWGRELRALQDNPNPVVDSVLRRSYDGLSRAEKDLFLDLACFYGYWNTEELKRLEEMLTAGGRGNLITNLVDKSLISIVTDGGRIKMKMNALLQDLGCSIVNEEHQIEERSRLWKAKDVSYLFRENKGTQSTEGIQTCSWDPIAICALEPDAFAKMENLRFLIIFGDACNLILPEDGLKYLPNALRVLKWPYFASKCLPSKFSAQNLVKLDLQNSKIEQLWQDDELNVDLGNLTFLSLESSWRLSKLPDLSTAKRLKEIYLNNCGRLVELPTSILDLPMLESLDVSACRNLKWDNLEDYASSSREQTSDMLPNLTKLNLSWTPIQKVPNFIARLHILKLKCRNCTKLTEFPVIPSLESLTLTGSLIKEVVKLEKLSKVKRLKLSENKQLVLISGDCSKLKSLEVIDLKDCSKLSRLPDSIGNLIHLLSLDLSYTSVTALPSSTGDLIRLTALILNCCKCLASLPDTIHKLPRLYGLVLNGCEQLRHLPELPSSLAGLSARSCKSLQTVSIGIVEKHFIHSHWCFAHCWKLDPVACSKLVDKFAKDVVRIFTDSSLSLPAKWDSEGGDEEGSAVGSNSSNYNTMATAKFRGQPWKSQLTIFCALLNPLDPLSIPEDSNIRIECLMLNNKDHAEAEVVSDFRWSPYRECKDQQEEHLSKGHFVVWSTRRYLVGETNADEGSTLKFFFRGVYMEYGESKTILNLIKNCRVIPVYPDRVVTSVEEEDDDEDEDEDEDDDDDGYDYYVFPENLQGLYDKLCASSEST